MSPPLEVGRNSAPLSRIPPNAEALKRADIRTPGVENHAHAFFNMKPLYKKLVLGPAKY